MNKREYIVMSRLEDEHFWFVGKRMFVDSVLNLYSGKISKILDIGSGTGGMTAFMAKYGKVTGVEQNPLAISLAKKRGIKLIKGNANSLKFNKNSFDLITIFDVLYHKNIKNEVLVLKNVRRFLRPNGLLLITDSAFKFLESGHDVAVAGKTRYSALTMRRIVESAGFKVVRSSYIYFTLFPVVLVKRLVFDKISKSKNSDVSPINKNLNTIFKALISLEAKVFKKINFPLGTSVIILAKKN